MNGIKKLTAFLLMACLMLSTAALSSCGSEAEAVEESLKSQIEDKAMAYMTDLEDSMATLTDNSRVQEYLIYWAESKGVEVSSDSYGNVFMTVEASQSYEDASPTVVICQYDASGSGGISRYIPAMASALYLAKNTVGMGDLTVIFSPETQNDFSGIINLDSAYLPDDANVFCLNPGESQMWSFNSGGFSTYRFTGDVEYTDPSGDVAYTITIQGLPGGIPDDGISDYPNPIKELGDLLAALKTNAIIFELADITGGSSAALYPESASITVVVDSSYVTKLESRLDSAIEKFMEKYSEEFPEATYTFEETSLPAQVFTKDTLNDFISTLYTIVNGEYQRDSGNDLISITNLGMIRCSDTTWYVQASANSLTEESMEEIDQTYMTICSLADITYEKTGNHDGWTAAPDSEFAQDLAEAFNEYTGDDMTYMNCVQATSAAYVYEKNPDCSIVNVVIGEDEVERYTGTIVTFMANLIDTEEEQD